MAAGPTLSPNAQREHDAAVRAHEAARAPAGRQEVVLPFGVRKPLAEVAPAQPFFQPANDWLTHPEKYLKQPDLAQWTYAWPCKDHGETIGKLSAGVYIAVTKSELKDDAPVTHKGTDDHVYWYTHILVKMSKRQAYAQYEQPMFESVRRVAAQEDRWRSQVETESRGLATGDISKVGTQESR